MNEKLKCSFIFLSGAAIGSVVTRYFVRKKALAMLDDEIEKTKAYFMKKAENEEPEIGHVRETVDTLEQNYDIPSEAYAVDYTAFYKRKTEMELAEEEHPEEDEPDEDYKTGEEMSKEADRDGIEIISRNSYDHDLRQFEKEELIYWVVDGVFTDAQEQMLSADPNQIDNLSAIVGTTIYDSGFIDDPEVKEIYIRNFNLGCDYRISKTNASYMQTIR